MPTRGVGVELGVAAGAEVFERAELLAPAAEPDPTPDGLAEGAGPAEQATRVRASTGASAAAARQAWVRRGE